MIEEAYVSFETAKLLKEKGFNEENCYSYYGYSNIANAIKRPTQQMAMRWLREVHNIHISIYLFDRDTPITENTVYTVDVATIRLSPNMGHFRGVWKTYEEAVEAAIKYCLENLI